MTLRRAGYFLAVTLAFIFTCLAVLSAVAFATKQKSTDYELVSTWGSKGNGPGEFDTPAGIKIYQGEIFIADVANHRIQVFDLKGEFKRQFGSYGEQQGQFNKPWNMLFHKGELYVAAYRNDRIDVFDPKGEFKRTIANAEFQPKDYGSVISLAVDAEENLVVVDFINHRVLRLSQEGEFINQWGTAGAIGMGAGEFNYPMDIATSPDGAMIYVADSYNDRVQVFGVDGQFKFKWGGPFASNLLISMYHWFPFNGWFSVIFALAVDSQGNVFVGDWKNQRIQKFTANGEFLTSFGIDQAGESGFGGTGGIAVADDGTVFVVDQENNRVQEWRPKSL